VVETRYPPVAEIEADGESPKDTNEVGCDFNKKESKKNRKVNINLMRWY